MICLPHKARSGKSREDSRARGGHPLSKGEERLKKIGFEMIIF
jgi:hypothetical protein